MAEKIEDGGPAYPRGMSLRDYFAGQALAGLCSSADMDGYWQVSDDEAAIKAYRIADHMLVERKAGA